jgi:Peptidase family S41
MVRRQSRSSGTGSAGAASSRTGRLSPADQKKLIEIAQELIETLYVHLPLKRAMYAVNPLQRLKLLRRRLGQKPQLEKREFFNELLSIFNQLRDLHTTFVLPEPFRSAFAYLPFELERCVDDADEDDEDMYVVSQVKTEEEEPIDPDFRRGSIVTYWNGTPIRLVVAANAEREAGSNPAARLAQGLAALTIRWLGQSLPPDEEWVDIVYLPGPGKAPKQIRFKWKVFQRKQTGGAAAATAIAVARGENRLRIGMDVRGESERQIRRHLFDEAHKQSPHVKHFGKDTNSGVAKWAREVFPVCSNVRTSAGLFAYVRIATFNVDNEKKYINEFARIISHLSQNGLILDVRGNGGGLISFGERMLQLLTPRPIDPTRFSFLNSARTQNLTDKYAFIREWRYSIAQSIETGTDYSQGFPLAPIEHYNDIGQKYQGPIVLVIDALCYSTTDIFAAGFQDHKIGIVLGVDETTGAGGANVWEYPLIAELFDDRQRFPMHLPNRASFRFAIRRVTRVGENSGVLLEDLGVKANKRHYMTRRDILERNVDLIERAAKILRKKEVQRLTVERQSPGKVRVRCQNLDRVDVYLDDRPLQGSLKVKRSSRLTQRLLTLTKKTADTARQLRLEGFRRNDQGRDELVAATRLPLSSELGRR